MPSQSRFFRTSGGQVVLLGVISRLQMRRNAGLLHLAGIGARGVQKRTARAARAIDQILRQCLKVLAVVVILFADHVDQPGPPATDADHLAALTQRANGYGANRGIEPRYVASAGQNSNDALLCFHRQCLVSLWWWSFHLDCGAEPLVTQHSNSPGGGWMGL